MKLVETIMYAILFYVCIGCFLWNFDSFDFPQKVIMFTLIAGFQCVVGLTRGNTEV